MPDLHPTAPSSAGTAPVPSETSRWLLDDADFALGCECADPALQIERWRQEASSAPDMN